MRKIVLLFCVFFFISKSLSAQCAMCKAVIEGGDKSVAEAVNSGITYLMVFPYILVGLLAFFLIRHRRNQK